MDILYTKHGHVMFEISSMIQKAIRRRDTDLAYYAANEMKDRYRSYLWKRLLTVSAEDCHDMVTSVIYKLREQDMNGDKNDSYISDAVSILLNAKKNRDADYFVCNYQNSYEKKDLRKYCDAISPDNTYLTRLGHSALDVRDYLLAALDALDADSVGYAAYELLMRYPKFYWNTLKKKAADIGCADLTEEISALQDIGQFKIVELASAKALVLVMKAIKRGGSETLRCSVIKDEISLSKYDNILYKIPEYVYDCHTRIGKARGKTKVDFIITEQAALNPFERGWFDNSSWDRLFFLDKNGWDNPNLPEAPMPDKKTIKELEEGVVQQNLF